jgi:hypothetical protein
LIAPDGNSPQPENGFALSKISEDKAPEESEEDLLDVIRALTKITNFFNSGKFFSSQTRDNQILRTLDNIKTADRQLLVNVPDNSRIKFKI